jgi:hypothetical protein
MILGLMISLAVSCSLIGLKNEKKYFEGRIIYKSEYFAKTNKVDTSNLVNVFGRTTELYFKNGNYLEKYDKGFWLEQLFIRANNKIYVKKNLSDTLFWINCEEPGRKILKSEIIRKKEKIAGIECDELITYYDGKKISFYFNSDTLRINPDWYSNYKFANKDVNSKKMKAIYLKYKMENADLIITVTATSISHQKIEDDLFIIPADKILAEETK